ncbi:uncharacterized protein BO88DRAFT_441861 [Aspergillus vadensis CBS 113365]|uniref:Uncharacterized protein n=1 Tax=Aspergillus vadensis (strain CBS 113365 / IMI 142717 / IBT 24658) TaxID=1448311 RepID=A0A319BI23_ASPVC|nr:hypothetical protein BO88DRAFT_441861 [Aspergillus vadensis CBS 113365]PYH72287.1 hypothetical protein BO88DRAFT_441861 [Aspergillus vadensis CBS 113365]
MLIPTVSPFLPNIRDSRREGVCNSQKIQCASRPPCLWRRLVLSPPHSIPNRRVHDRSAMSHTERNNDRAMGTSDLHNDGCRSVWGWQDPVKDGVQCIWMESSGESENLIVQDQHGRFSFQLSTCSLVIGPHGNSFCGTFDPQNT